MGRARTPLALAALAVALGACCTSDEYVHVRRPSSCVSNDECPPSTVCIRNTCMKDLGGARPAAGTMYGTYRLPEAEGGLAVAIIGPPRDTQTKVVLDILSTEVARYDLLHTESVLDLSEQMDVPLGLASEFDKLALAVKGATGSRPAPPYVVKAVYYYLESPTGRVPTLTIQLVSMRERKVLASVTKSFPSVDNIRATISPLVEEILRKELETRAK